MKYTHFTIYFEAIFEMKLNLNKCFNFFGLLYRVSSCGCTLYTNINNVFVQRFSHKFAHSFYFSCTCGQKRGRGAGTGTTTTGTGRLAMVSAGGGVRQMAPSCCLPNWVDAGTGAVDVASRRVMATKSLPRFWRSWKLTFQNRYKV